MQLKFDPLLIEKNVNFVYNQAVKLKEVFNTSFREMVTLTGFLIIYICFKRYFTYKAALCKFLSLQPAPKHQDACMCKCYLLLSNCCHGYSSSFNVISPNTIFINGWLNNDNKSARSTNKIRGKEEVLPIKALINT